MLPLSGGPGSPRGRWLRVASVEDSGEPPIELVGSAALIESSGDVGHAMEVWTCSHPPLPQFVGTEDTFIFGSDADEETARDRHRDDVAHSHRMVRSETMAKSAVTPSRYAIPVPALIHVPTPMSGMVAASRRW